MREIKKPLSERPLGYVIAVIGGSVGLPIGWIASPLVLLALNKTMKRTTDRTPNRFLRWALIGIVGAPASLVALVPFGQQVIEQDLKNCNLGSREACLSLLDNTSVHTRITNPDFARIRELDKLEKEKAKAQEDAKQRLEESLRVKADNERRLAEAKEREERIEQERAQRMSELKKRQEQRVAEQRRTELERLDQERREIAKWTKNGRPWAGCQTELKRQLRDPGSYQDDWAMPDPSINYEKMTVTYLWRFRSKNGFGGYSAAISTCVTSPNRQSSSDGWGGFGNPEVTIIQE